MGATAIARGQVWIDFNNALAVAASKTRTATVLDASPTMDEVEHEARRWINTRYPGTTSRRKTQPRSSLLQHD